MKYMLLIYHDQQAGNGHTESERQQIYGQYRQLIEDLKSLGKYPAAAAKPAWNGRETYRRSHKK